MFTAETLEVQVLVENWIDMLLPDIEGDDLHCVSRVGLINHFDPKLTPPQAENGIALLVRVKKNNRTTTILFDVGLTGRVLRHNFEALQRDPNEIDHLVISHGHPDHYGGVFELLGLLDRPLPIATHPDAFLPRYAVMGDGRTASFYNAAFNEEKVQAAEGRLVLSREPLDLGWGIATTGEIPRTVEFEGPSSPSAPRAPGLYQVGSSGDFRIDEVWDEQGLVVDVENEGLVVLTGCAHAGVINTILKARGIFGDKPVRAVMGGFHLGFPTTPAENVTRTVEAMRSLDVRTVMPMHCSGLRAHSVFASEMGDRYVQPAVGTILRFGG